MLGQDALDRLAWGPPYGWPCWRRAGLSSCRELGGLQAQDKRRPGSPPGSNAPTEGNCTDPNLRHARSVRIA